MPPSDPGVEHEQDPLQRRPIIEPLAPRVAKASLDPWQLRLDPQPELVRYDPRL
jgi:hypothetical protein